MKLRSTIKLLGLPPRKSRKPPCYSLLQIFPPCMEKKRILRVKNKSVKKWFLLLNVMWQTGWEGIWERMDTYEPCVSTKSLHLSPTLLRPYGPQTARLLCAWDSPGKNAGMGCHFLLQRIFPTQGSNPGLLHCRRILYCPWDSSGRNTGVDFHALLQVIFLTQGLNPHLLH